MKKVLIILASVLVLCGCASFGTFSNLEKGESTQGEIRSMLGEPAEKLFEDDREVWQYHFVKRDTKETGKLVTILNLEVIFKEDEVDNYKITVSKKSVQERQQDILLEKRELPRSGKPIKPRIRTEEDFVKQFDKDNDGRVSRGEFTGSVRAFNRLDKNNNGYIDENEAPEGPPPRKRKSRY